MNNTEEFIKLDEAYIEQMAELFKAAFSGEPRHDDWSDQTQLTGYIKDIACCSSSLNYGLISNGRLIAMSVGTVRRWWEGTNYNIEEFCVAPDKQGQNLGTRFMAMIEDDIKSKGISGIFLQTDSDKPSYRFYKKNGFDLLEAHVSLYKKL